MRIFNQSKIALLCVFLISKSLFASEIRPFDEKRTGLLPKPSGLPSFGGGSKGSPRPTRPNFGLKPKPILGTFGTSESELSKGNFRSAVASCIQEAIQGGDKIPGFDNSSVWEFASRGSSTTRPLAKLSPSMAALRVKLSSTAQTPAALVNKPCDDDLRQSACVSLLSKSTTEVTQAYHNSDLNTDRSVWDEVLTFLGLMPLYDENNESMDIVAVLKKDQDEQKKEV